MHPPDLEQFRAPACGNLHPVKPKQPPRHKTGEWFVKGPIPGEWISRAAKLPGKTLHTAMAIWYLAGLVKCGQVTLTHRVLSRLGVGRDAGRRGLHHLEAVGLIKVERHSGRCPIVSIENAPPTVTTVES